MDSHALSYTFFIQMAVILGACRVVGAVARRLGQPQVVGEMIAGVLLGPSLLGYFFPHWEDLIFPADSRKVLFVGAQLGVGLYMFLVGIEFRADLFRSKVRSAVSVSLAGMLVPFLLSLLLAPWLMKMPELFSERARLFEAVLFLGASMAITAFPMLARIIYERGLAGTSIGTLALAAGAIDDAASWCVLAIVLATFGSGAIVAIQAIGGGVLYALIMIFLMPKLLAPLGRIAEREGKITNTMLGVVLMLFCLGAWAMDSIRMHAVFGGFLLGVAMPRGFFAKELQKRLEPIVVVFLLPMFFCFSGLNTQLNVMSSGSLIVVTIVLIVASVVGKGVACWGAARLNREDNRTALAVGTLMNSRGLMELIILNIGLQQTVIKPAFFSIMVLMAIITTLMASPIFEWVYGRNARRTGELGEVPVT